MKRIAVVVCVMLVTACTNGSPQRDYDSSKACAERGVPTGTPEFEKCVSEERTTRMLEEQRREFEQRKADEEFWRNNRGY